MPRTGQRLRKGPAGQRELRDRYLPLIDDFFAVVFRFDFLARTALVGQVHSPQVGDGELAEDVVDDARRHLDVIVARHHSRRFELGEHKSVDELVQRHAVLQAE